MKRQVHACGCFRARRPHKCMSDSSSNRLLVYDAAALFATSPSYVSAQRCYYMNYDAHEVLQSLHTLER
jgi:hypothetical protein